MTVLPNTRRAELRMNPTALVSSVRFMAPRKELRVAVQLVSQARDNPVIDAEIGRMGQADPEWLELFMNAASVIDDWNSRYTEPLNERQIRTIGTEFDVRVDARNRGKGKPGGRGTEEPRDPNGPTGAGKGTASAATGAGKSTAAAASGSQGAASSQSGAATHPKGSGGSRGPATTKGKGFGGSKGGETTNPKGGGGSRGPATTKGERMAGRGTTMEQSGLAAPR
jgi:hypothetical protein